MEGARLSSCCAARRSMLRRTGRDFHEIAVTCARSARGSMACSRRRPRSEWSASASPAREDGGSAHRTNSRARSLVLAVERATPVTRRRSAGRSGDAARVRMVRLLRCRRWHRVAHGSGGAGGGGSANRSSAASSSGRETAVMSGIRGNRRVRVQIVYCARAASTVPGRWRIGTGRVLPCASPESQGRIEPPQGRRLSAAPGRASRSSCRSRRRCRATPPARHRADLRSSDADHVACRTRWRWRCLWCASA